MLSVNRISVSYMNSKLHFDAVPYRYNSAEASKKSGRLGG